jgi:hypothetical protein
MSQARFQKRMREKAKQEKAAAKRARRAERAEAALATSEEPADDDVPEQEDVIAQLAKLHERFDDDRIDFDTFQEEKQELIAQLRVD